MAACRIDKHLASRIKSLRQETGLSPADMAAEMSLSELDYVAIENGKVRIGALDMARIAQTLRRPVRWFYEGLPGQAVFDR